MKAEGKNPVRELLGSGATIEKISIENGSRDNEIRSLVQIARDKGIKVDYVDKDGQMLSNGQLNIKAFNSTGL